MKFSSLSEEKKLWKKGFKKVACIDEAGCGPLAGPVVAAAIIFKLKNLPPVSREKISPSLGLRKRGEKLKTKENKNLKILMNSLKLLKRLRDSKKVSLKRREEIFNFILQNSEIFDYGIGIVPARIIDNINIRNAAELAMERAVKKLRIKPDFLIIDGCFLKNRKLKSFKYKLMVKADEKVFSCSLASILAKVTRDKIMLGIHKKYPQYRFDLHKGYPTKKHLKMLKKYGPCVIHRKSFAPVFNMVK